MDRYTSCYVELDLYDTTANQDSTLSVDNVQTFCDIESIRKQTEINKIATLENNYFLLDGSFSFYDDYSGDNFGYMSKLFNSKIEADFKNNHSSAGITFYFWETIPESIKLTFLNDGSIVSQKTVYPKLSECEKIELQYIELDFSRDFLFSNGKNLYISQPGTIGYEYFADVGAEDYDHMIVELNGGDRFIRINAIDYGIKLHYGDEYKRKVKSCNVTEQIDPIASELPISQSKLEVIDTENLFDITNPKSYYKYLQKRQTFKLYEVINDKEELVATHYLKEWSQTKQLLATFDLQDVIGSMNDTTFYGGMYVERAVKSLVDDVMRDFGFENYIIDEELASIKLTGYIGITTHRQALQQIAFACGGCIKTSRSNGIVLFKPNLDTSGIIEANRKLISKSHEISQKDLITGVLMVAHDYQPSGKVEEVYKGDFIEGTYLITFNKPCTNLTISEGQILESNCNYAKVKVPNGQIVVTGTTYEDHKVEYIYKTNELPSAANENVVRIDNATLISKANAQTRAQKIYEIKQYRLEHSLFVINENESVANMYAIKSNDGYAPVFFTKMDTDLTGGFISTCEGIGYALRVVDYYKTGNELYTGEEGII